MAQKIILPADAIVELKAADALRRTLTNEALALMFNVSPGTIRNVLDEAGYKRSPTRSVGNSGRSCGEVDP